MLASALCKEVVLESPFFQVMPNSYLNDLQGQQASLLGIRETFGSVPDNACNWYVHTYVSCQNNREFIVVYDLLCFG